MTQTSPDHRLRVEFDRLRRDIARGGERPDVFGRLQSLGAASAALAIARMDPHARKDLIACVRSLDKARAADDAEEMDYLRDAIRELLTLPSAAPHAAGPTLEQFEAALLRAPGGRAARGAVDARRAAFAGAYARLKQEAGWRTQQDVADAAGLSLPTVQAIESNRVTPRFATVCKLAEAFAQRLGRPVAAADLWPPA